MKIGIVGLGLIGASFAKAIKVNTEHRIFGFDMSEDVNMKARMLKVIDDRLGADNLKTCDMVIVALYPADAIKYIRENADRFKPDAIVMDCCGVKNIVCNSVNDIAKRYGFVFIGAHPMAGLEYSGFEYSKQNLFANASMILTAPLDTPIHALDAVKSLCSRIGFKNIEICSPLEHDRIIAFTSQLAHVVSNAYIKSPTASEHQGFSAGSYKDMTRVATLNEKMWTELFMDNRENLLFEVDTLIENLTKYSNALRNGDYNGLQELLADGRKRKEYVDGKERTFWK